MAQLKKFTLRRCPTIHANRNVLATAGICCTTSPSLSGVMEDCSIVRVQQPQIRYRRRCCMSASQRMFGLLWNVVVAHEHRRQDGSRRLVSTCTMVKCQTATLNYRIALQ